jgi:BON domain
MLRNLGGFTCAAALLFTVACGQTDAGITTAVKSKLAADDTVKAYQVDVNTENHVVTLSGMVETPAAKATAVQLARTTDGVRDVIDQITIGTTAATSGRADVDVDTPDVDVDVDDNLERDVKQGAESTGNAVERGASATAEAARKAGQATAEGAKKVGGAIRDSVTDDDRDSDKDGH